MRWGPISGLSCMIVAVCSIAASLAILVTSHNSPNDQWEFQPSVYLAVFTAVANHALRKAVVHGVAIAWWTRAQGNFSQRIAIRVRVAERSPKLDSFLRWLWYYNDRACLYSIRLGSCRWPPSAKS